MNSWAAGIGLVKIGGEIMDETRTQALETRRRNAEVRKQRRDALEAEQKQDKALVLSALRAVLQDPNASTSERLFALIVLDSVKCYNLVPYDMKHKRSTDDLIKDFAKRLDTFQEKGK